MKLAVLDDYQRLALEYADWKSLKGVDVRVFDRPLARPRHDGPRRPIAEQVRVHEARDPVAEAIGGVERTDDQSRPHLRRARPEQSLDRRFARRLQRTVLFHHRFGRRVGERRDRRRLVEIRTVSFRVDRHRRHEHIARNPLRQNSRARLDDPRNVTGAVDHGIPRAAFERL